jgi:glycine oxidase
MSKSWDVVILGGGIIGLSIAHRLLRHRLQVLLLDRAVPNDGKSASWSAGGIIPPASPVSGQEAIQRLRGYSYQQYPTWIGSLQEDSGMDLEFLRSGGIHIARSPVARAMLRVAQQQWHEEGVPCAWVEPEELPTLEAGLLEGVRSGLIHGAVWVPGECQVRPTRVLQSLRMILKARGIPIQVVAEPPRIELNGTDRITVSCQDAEIQCHKLVVSAGPWSKEILLSLGSRINLEPRRGQMALLRSEPGKIRHILNEGPRYVVPRRDGYVLIGSTVEDVGFDFKHNPSDIEAMVMDAKRWLTSLRDAEQVEAWSGLRPYTADGLPILGSLRSAPEVVIATGHFRSGFELAPVTAQIVEESLGLAPRTIEIYPFRPDRF